MSRAYVSRPITDEILEQFERRLPLIERGEQECWPYSEGAARSETYGRVSRQVRGAFQQAVAHRVSLTHFLGRALEPTEIVMHSCDYKPCVNPGHLEVGTAGQNQSAAYARGLRGSQKGLPRGGRAA